jgi:DivIVA domain-containing protein
LQLAAAFVLQLLALPRVIHYQPALDGGGKGGTVGHCPATGELRAHRDVERALTTAWFDEQERLTPDELQSATFPMSRLGRRGFDEESVRRFLRSVHAEFVRLVNDRASLWQEVQRLRQRFLASTDGDPQAALFGDADAHIRALRIVSTAQLTADRCVAGAQAYGSKVTGEARRRRDHVVQQAQQRSDTFLEDARAQALEAAVSALNLPVLRQTDRERQAVQAELAYLRTYSEFYRAHLRAYTEGLLRGIGEREASSSHEAAQAPEDHRSVGP